VTPAFDQSGRPVPVTDFDHGALSQDVLQKGKRDLLDEIQTVRDWFQDRYKWILAGRTPRSREIRRAIVRSETEGPTLGEIARRFGVTRQGLYKQASGLRKLTRFS
jgi:DNA-directed RNA polymerase sigma subunit (sigma70/sigma32)